VDVLSSGVLAAPQLLPVEVAHVLRRAERRGVITTAVAATGHEELLALPADLHPDGEVGVRAGGAAPEPHELRRLVRSSGRSPRLPPCDVGPTVGTRKRTGLSLPHSVSGYDGATFVAMTQIPTRELRNDTAGVLRRVQAGENIVITVKGEPVAELVPIRPARRRWIGWDELVERLPSIQADPGLRADLQKLAGDTTDDLGPIQ
jgi:prevent-host-death family protein